MNASKLHNPPPLNLLQPMDYMMTTIDVFTMQSIDNKDVNSSPNLEEIVASFGGFEALMASELEPFVPTNGGSGESCDYVIEAPAPCGQDNSDSKGSESEQVQSEVLWLKRDGPHCRFRGISEIDMRAKDHMLVQSLLERDAERFVQRVRNRIALCERMGYSASTYHRLLEVAAPLLQLMRPQGAMMSGQYTHTHNLSTEVDEVLEGVMSQLSDISDKMFATSANFVNGATHVGNAVGSAKDNIKYYLGIALLIVVVALIAYHVNRDVPGYHALVIPLSALMGVLGTLLATHVDFGDLMSRVGQWFTTSPTDSIVLQSDPVEEGSEIGRLVCELVSIVFFSTRVKFDSGVDTLLRSLNSAESDARTVGNVFTRISDTVIRIVEKVCHAAGFDVSLTVQSGFMHAFKDIESEIKTLMAEVDTLDYVTHVHEAKLKGLIDNITALLVRMPAKTENNVVRSKLNTTLAIVKSSLTQVRHRLQALAGARFETFCFNLVGTPGCGKTTLIYKSLYRFLALVATEQELPRLEEITKQAVNVIGNSTKYFDGFDPRLWITVINEIFQGKEPKDATAFSRLLIDMLGGNKCPLPMAAIEAKGVTNFEARMMLCAGNNLSLPKLNGLEEVGQHALMRRMNTCCWRMYVVLEFAKLDGEGKPIVQGCTPPGMHSNPYGYMLDTDKAHALPLIDGEPNMAPFRLVKWDYASAKPKNMRAYTVDEFFNELKVEYELHRSKQYKLLNTTETSRAAFLARMMPSDPIVAQGLTTYVEDEGYDTAEERHELTDIVDQLAIEVTRPDRCLLSFHQHRLAFSSDCGHSEFLDRMISDCTCSDEARGYWKSAALLDREGASILESALDDATDIVLQSGATVVTQDNLEDVLNSSSREYESYCIAIRELRAKQKTLRATERSVSVREFIGAVAESHDLLRSDPSFHERFQAGVNEYLIEPAAQLYAHSKAFCLEAYRSSLESAKMYIECVTRSYDEASRKCWLWFVDHPVLALFGVTAGGVFVGGLLYQAVKSLVAGYAVSEQVAPPRASSVESTTEMVFPDPVVEQAKLTTGMDNVRTVVLQNTYSIKLTVQHKPGSYVSKSGHAVFARGRSFITNAHIWNCTGVPEFKTSSEDILVELFRVGTGEKVFSFYKKYALVRCDYEMHDISIVTCPVGIREHKDITSFMLSVDDHSAMKVIRSENLSGYMLDSTAQYRSGLFHYSGAQSYPYPSRVVIPHSLSVGLPTADGDCGLPILVSSPSLTRVGKTELVFTGIHFAKREFAVCGLSNVITSNIFKGLPISSGNGGSSDVLTLQSYVERVSGLSTATPSDRSFVPTLEPMLGLPQRVVGEVVPPFSNVTMSDYHRAPLYKVASEELAALGYDIIDKKCPVNLRDTPGATPLTIESFAGYGQNKHHLTDPLLLRDIIGVVASNISESNHVSSRDVPLLQYSDVINEGELQSLDLTKASGPVCKTMCGILRKDLFPERDLTHPAAVEFFQFMESYEEDVVQGTIDLVQVSSQALKSELRPKSKVVPRTFLMQELTYHLLAKKYLGQFVDAAPTLGMGVAVGMNTYKEAAWLYTEFKTDHTIVGDHEKFDKYQLAEITMQMGAIVEAFYKGTPHDNPRAALLRKKLLYTLVHWYAIVTARGRSVVVEVDGAMPSGDLRTAVFNSMYNFVATTYVICRAWQRKFPDVRSVSRDSIAKLVRNMRAKFYGDDFLLSLEHVPELHWFSFFDLKRGFAEEFGTVLTTSRKDGLEAPFQILEEEMWLGRHFKVLDGEPVLALKIPSIFGCLYFQRRGVSASDYRQMVENSLMELSLHGRDLFDQIAPLVQQQFHRCCGAMLVNTDYEAARLNCRSRTNEY